MAKETGTLFIQPKIVGTSNETGHFGLVRPEYSGPTLMVVHFDRSGHFGWSDRNVRSIGQVEFPKFQTGIFVEWKAPGVSLQLTEVETRLSRNLVKLGGERQAKYQVREGGSKLE